VVVLQICHVSSRKWQSEEENNTIQDNANQQNNDDNLVVITFPDGTMRRAGDFITKEEIEKIGIYQKIVYLYIDNTVLIPKNND